MALLSCPVEKAKRSPSENSRHRPYREVAVTRRRAPRGKGPGAIRAVTPASLRGRAAQPDSLPCKAMRSGRAVRRGMSYVRLWPEQRKHVGDPTILGELIPVRLSLGRSHRGDRSRSPRHSRSVHFTRMDGQVSLRLRTDRKGFSRRICLVQQIRD